MKIWQLIIEIIHAIVKWIDWYMSDKRKRIKAAEKLLHAGIRDHDEAKITAGFDRLNREKK